ncbi:serine/threonine protein kinase [Actinoplanes sp. LDG1-06]|uniref:non-specific serine/threonine protein kinase n=1 Tax=Paractinoplanes ovalisporus TaxID=2810368 RepID=A0ABS2ANV5_9ACTN|nr:serine/threonine-protein kinase [Actinoplanes ovalisporus]MBM2621453.1 serine/threonine protein kinase [Actinoplanes ovalisporus]
MPSPGEILGGRYRLDDRIAAGGMGEVWRATDTVLGRDVAVKTLHADRAGDPGFQERFRHEARSMAALHHPGVADVYDFGETEGGADAYIVMARIDGEPLNERIAERGRLTPAETMSVVAQAARALEAAHEAGIVHRDVKPSNLIIKPDGTVVLVDFGVARSASSSTLTGAREVVGTAMYIAPEQVSKETTGPPADIYALGVVAYHCLAGQPPFTGENPIAIAMQHVTEAPPDLPGDIPPAVRAVALRAMAKQPEDRFPNAAAMAEAADRAMSSSPGVSGGDTTAILAAPRYAAAATPKTLSEQPVRGSGARRSTMVLAGAGALVLVAAIAALAFLLPDDDKDPGPASPSQSVQGSAGTGDAPEPVSTKTRTRPPGTTTTTRPAPPANVPSDSPEPEEPEPQPDDSTSVSPPEEPPGEGEEPGGDDPSSPTGGGDGTGNGSGSGSGSGGQETEAGSTTGTGSVVTNP